MDIVYEIIRSDRRTISLGLKRGKVIVRAPRRLSEQYIADFVMRHRAWLLKRLAAADAAPKLDLTDGSELVLFGRHYTIATGRTRLGGGVAYLPEAGREEALTRLLKKLAKEVMTLFTAGVAERRGFTYAGVRISSARARWGSCNRNGVIAYTFRVAFLPPKLCEYVVVHELAHTVVFDHSAAFWQVVARALPDWKERRKALKNDRSIDFL